MKRYAIAALFPLLMWGDPGCQWTSPPLKPGTVAESVYKIYRSNQDTSQCFGRMTAQGNTFTSTWTVPCRTYPPGFCTMAKRTTKPTGSFFNC